MTPKIHVLIGMIASGKSTYCKTAAKHGALIMNDDAIVNMLHADEYTLYDKNLKVIYKSIENYIVSLGLCANRTVIIDRGLNISKYGRERWITMARSFDVTCEAVLFALDIPEVHAKRRFESDSRGHTYDYWLEVATAHHKAYKFPTRQEGFSKIHHITFEDIKNGRVF